MPSVLELIKDFKLSNFSIVSPGVYSSLPGAVSLAAYWTDVFNSPDESSERRVLVQTVRVNGGSTYFERFSLSECLDNESTFYWDNANQKLYIHFTIDVDPLFDNVTYGIAYGFCSGQTLYIEDQEYLPVIEGVPSVAQSEDLVDYDLLDFISGAFNLNNSNSDLDFIIDENVIGNDVFFYHIPEGKSSRSDLIRLGSYNVENYNISQDLCSIDVIDKRQSGDIKIPTEEFTSEIYPNIDPEIVGDIIPLMFGEVRESSVIIVNSESNTGNVECVVAQELNSLGQVQIKEGDEWVNITPESYNLSTGFISLIGNSLFVESAIATDNGSGKVRITKNGEFVGLNEGDSIKCVFGSIYDSKVYRVQSLDSSANYIDINLTYVSDVNGVTCEVFSAARESSGSIKDIKVVNPTGVVIEKTTDIIVWLADRYENAPFDSEGYDIDAWEDVGFYLSSGSYMIKDRINIYDAYKAVQEGSTFRFRYDFTFDGKRTLKLNDENLIPKGNIYHQDFDEIEVSSDTNVIFSQVTVYYDKSYYTDKYLKTKNTDNRVDVINTFRKDSNLDVFSLLNNKSDADFRALSDSNRFSISPETVPLRLKGQEYLDIEIYDIFNIELTKGFVNLDDESIEGREFYGLRRCQVLGVDPDSENVTNDVTFKILGAAKFRDTLIFDDGTMMIFDNGDTMTNDGVG